MGHIKDLLVTIYGGGEEAVNAAVKLADIEKQKRAYDDVMRARNSESDIDIVAFLRGLSFATNSPSADDSAKLLHYAANETADLIESMREERRWIPVSERFPDFLQVVCVRGTTTDSDPVAFCDTAWREEYSNGEPFWSGLCGEGDDINITHWMALPEMPRSE
jgi:hypothetical protein